MPTTVPSKEVLGVVLRGLRLANSVSQEAVAAKAKLHRNYVGFVERGERDASFQTVAKLLRALGVSWAEFGEALERAKGLRPAERRKR